MDDAGHSLLLAFDTEAPEFARGFEIGRLWALLRERPDEEIVEHVHAANAEMLLRIGEATRRRVQTVDLDETWVAVTFGAAADVDSS